MWRVRLPGTAPAARLPLDPSERARADRFRRPRDAARFSHARAFLRRVLSGYLELSPDEVRFEFGEHGKPMLPGDPPPLRFNLSHSSDLAVCALSRLHPVGVDVEAVRDLSGLDDIARRHLTSRERELLDAAGDARARLLAFYRIWTRKEALLKGIGVGFAWPLSCLCVAGPEPELAPDGEGSGARARRVPEGPRGGPDRVADWVLHDLAAPPGFQGALAVPHHGMDLVYVSDGSTRDSV